METIRGCTHRSLKDFSNTQRKLNKCFINITGVRTPHCSSFVFPPGQAGVQNRCGRGCSLNIFTLLFLLFGLVSDTLDNLLGVAPGTGSDEREKFAGLPVST